MEKQRNLTLEVKCVSCGKVIELKVAKEDYEEFTSSSRRHIQDIFPYLSPSERELFLSGMCDDCWNEMFKDYTVTLNNC